MTLPTPTSESIGHIEHHTVLHDWYNDFQAFLFTGPGSPEGVVAAGLGSLYMDTTNGHVYHKQTGSGGTGWERLLDTTDTIGGGGGGEPDPHASTHELLGSDVVNIANLIEDGDPQVDEVLTWDGSKPVWEPVPEPPPSGVGDHADSHAFTGGDALPIETQINDTPATSQVITWDGTKAVWSPVPGTVGGGNVPDGGTEGQVLVKDSATNQDTSWYPLFNQSDNGVRYVRPGASGNGFSPWNPMGSLDNALSDVNTAVARHIELVEPGTYTISAGATITGAGREFSLKARFQQPQRRFSQATTQGGTIIRSSSPNQQHVLRISPANSAGPNYYGVVIEGITFNPADVIAPATPTIAPNAQATGNINGALRFEGNTFWEVRRCTFGLAAGATFRPVYLVVSTNVNAAGAPVTADGDSGSWAIFERNTGWGTCALYQNHSGGGGGNRMQIQANVFSGIGGHGTTTGGATRPFIQLVGPDSGDELFMDHNNMELTNPGVAGASLYGILNAVIGPDGFERLGVAVGGSQTGNYAYYFQNCTNILILGCRGGNSTFNIQDGGGNTGMRAVVANYTGPFAT